MRKADMSYARDKKRKKRRKRSKCMRCFEDKIIPFLLLLDEDKQEEKKK